jgi:hypothetical protein
MQVTTLAEELAASKRAVEDLRAQVAHAAAPHAPGAVANLLDVVHSAGEEEAKARAVLVDQLAVKEVSYLFVVAVAAVVAVVAVVALAVKEVSYLLVISLTHRSHSISFARAQGIPKYKIEFGRGK